MKLVREGAVLIVSGRSFHEAEAALLNARSPYEILVNGLTGDIAFRSQQASWVVGLEKVSNIPRCNSLVV